MELKLLAITEPSSSTVASFLFIPNGMPQQKNQGLKSTNTTEGKESHGEHVKNFIDCIKTRNKTACPPETGRAAALHVHIPNIAARVGESMLIWDDANNRFTNSSEAANALITACLRRA